MLRCLIFIGFAAAFLITGCQEKTPNKAPLAQKKPYKQKLAAKPELKPNEAGKVMILLYHKIGRPEKRWQRTPENFRKDLERLYKNGYRLLSLQDFVNNRISTPAGYTPVVLTFDDASPGQFRYIRKNGKQIIDPDSAVGILKSFFEKHPDFGLEATFFVLWDAAFGTPEEMEQKVKHLLELGFDIGNHTLNHTNLRKLDNRAIQKEIALSAKRAYSFLPKYPFHLLALPYGAIPKNDKVLEKGEFAGFRYENKAVLLVGAEPALPPYHVDYKSFRVPRIQAIDSELNKWLDYFQRYPGERFISDGNPNVTTIPLDYKELIAKDKLGRKKLKTYPLIPHSPQARNRQPVWAKGIYVTGWVAGSKKRFEKILKLVRSTELNAVVIDVKDADGVVGYRSHIPLIQKIGAYQRRMRNPREVLARLLQNNIYPIARIVVFKDNVLPRKKRAWAVQKKDGELWEDRKKFSWSDPYNKQVWDYNVAIAIEAARLGFREIQFDYVRFPSDGRVSYAVYPRKDRRPPEFVISQFLAYARQQLAPYEVFVSADFFGLTGAVEHDMGIGQIVQRVAPYLDFLSPMAYPSHYARGEYGIKIPDLAPYRIVYYSLRDTARKIGGRRALVRPWLQAFSLNGYEYGPAELKAQINATYAAGFSQWLLWNPRCQYKQVKAALRLASS